MIFYLRKVKYEVSLHVEGQAGQEKWIFWDSSTMKVKALQTFKTLGPISPSKQHSIPEDFEIPTLKVTGV